jgi:hypothetical protein
LPTWYSSKTLTGGRSIAFTTLAIELGSLCNVAAADLLGGRQDLDPAAGRELHSLGAEGSLCGALRFWMTILDV